MREFVELVERLDRTTSTKRKVDAIASYFGTAKPADAAWATFFLTGRRLKSVVKRSNLMRWAANVAGIPDWLCDECYGAVADSAETVALLLPDHQVPDKPLELAEWVEKLIVPMRGIAEPEQQKILIDSWTSLDRASRFVFNKWLTGGFRVGVSELLVVRALAKASGITESTIARRLMGDWTPSAEFFEHLLHSDEVFESAGHPYPFALAHALQDAPDALGPREKWIAEWKWDGIRCQAIRRGDLVTLWSRGEGMIGDSFPEIVDAVKEWPDGTVVDGEILAWNHGAPLPFTDLQRRLHRKSPGKKLLTEVPCVLVGFDLIEQNGEDLRQVPTYERRRRLTQAALPQLYVSPEVDVDTWAALAEQRLMAKEKGVEGLMLKLAEAPYPHGRKAGVWWKWKVDPCTIDAVLVYAQRGSGKRASLYSDYTFAVWDGDKLVPFAKAYSGLTDAEIAEVDAFVRRSSGERFGPVRTVPAELVFELAFEGIQLSKRHKSGVAVRFPRILPWRKDKSAHEADRLESIRALLGTTP